MIVARGNPSPDTTSMVEPPVPSVQFDGSQALEFSRRRVLDRYTLDVMLEMADDVDLPAVPEYGPLSPPMPFLLVGSAGRIAAYAAVALKIIVRDDQGETLFNGRVGPRHGPIRLTFAGGPDGLIIYVNGGEVVRTTTPHRLNLNGRVGAGNFSRFWRGEIAYFDIYSDIIVEGEFDQDPTQRLDPEFRILELSDMQWEVSEEN
jgi:hypothetical protein